MSRPAGSPPCRSCLRSCGTSASCAGATSRWPRRSRRSSTRSTISARRWRDGVDSERMPPTRLGRRAFVGGGVAALLATRVAAQTTPASAGPVDRALIDDLVAANRILADQGVVDGYGHVSVRHPGDPHRYLMSRSIAPELVTADDVMEYDLDSTAVDARGRSSYLERFIHGEIYRARADVKAVVHNHSPSVIPFGVSTVPLRPLYHMSAFLGGGVPVFDIKAAAGEATDMLVRTPAIQSPAAARPIARGAACGAAGPTTTA